MHKAPDSIPVLIVGGGPVGLALAGDLGWRSQNCLLVEESDGSIYQPRQDLVGIRTMEFCRRWGLVPAVEAAPYPRDVPQDNVYVTSLCGYELGRERFPSMGADRPPSVSPQKRERCPQNMFDPILRAFAASHGGVELRYRTRLVSFVQDGDGVTAELEDLAENRRYHVRTRAICGCDGARSLVRETLGIAMQGNPALTYTTNVIFRCPDLVALHDKGEAYRFIILGPEGTWATIVAINGRDQWRFSIIGGAEPHELSQDEIHAAIRAERSRSGQAQGTGRVPDEARSDQEVASGRNGRRRCDSTLDAPQQHTRQQRHRDDDIAGNIIVMYPAVRSLLDDVSRHQ